MGTTVILADYATKETFVLSEMLGKKIATRSSAEFIHQLEMENNLKNPTKITPIKKTKKIAGFTCKSVNISTSSNNQAYNFTCYYCPDLPNVSYSVTSEISSQIQGMMLEYDMLSNGVQMHIVANKIKSKTIMDEAFIVPPDYEIISEQSGMK